MIYKSKYKEGDFKDALILCDDNFRGIYLNKSKRIKQFRFDNWNRQYLEKLNKNFKIKFKADFKNIKIDKPFIIYIGNIIYFHEKHINIVDKYDTLTKKLTETPYDYFYESIKVINFKKKQTIILKNK